MNTLILNNHLKMTRYDMLIDSITTELFNYWEDAVNGEQWNDDAAKQTAHQILEMVEDYQSTKPTKTWRASD